MKKILIFTCFVMSFVFLACSGNKDKNVNKPVSEAKPEVQKEVIDHMLHEGVGPIKGLTIDEAIDQEMVKKGAQVFKLKCIACHKPYRKFIGPDVAGVTERRNPSWIMNMILVPEKMVKEDPIAKQLLKEYNGSPMLNQNVKKEEARAILEYFRTLN